MPCLCQLKNYLQTPLLKVKIPLTLKWKRRSDMPFIVGDYPQAVIIRKRLYIGGGWTLLKGERQTVLVCDLTHDIWVKLPPYECTRFAMTSISDQLVLVGGLDINSHKHIAKLGVWDEQLQRWTAPFQPMPTARRSPSIVTHDNRWLVVMGGENEDAVLSVVEILDTISGQWYCASPMPKPCFCASAVTVGNICYILGGFTTDGFQCDRVVSCCLDELISKAVLEQASLGSSPLESISPLESLSLPLSAVKSVPLQHLASSAKSPWQSLPRTPLTQSTALAFEGALLAIGGLEEHLVSKSIYLYQPDCKKWVKAGQLFTARAACACIVLPGKREILIAGGSTSIDRYGSVVGSITGSTSEMVELALLC